MDTAPFFEFDSYHLLVTVMGVVIILAYWLPRFVSSREPAAAPLLILFGAIAYWVLPDTMTVPDPRDHPHAWEIASELAVIAALFSAGLRLDSLSPWKKWRPTVSLLLIGMPCTIAAVALLGWGLAGMTIAGAILLGAVLAPTDPVLAGDVQVGPPLEGREHPVRFTLTTEAALNDGLAFPFVYLGLIIALHGANPQGWLFDWLAVDVVYRIAVALAMGTAGGWVLGQVLFAIPRGAVLADTGAGIVAIAGVLLCYGSTELAEGYGFISVAMMGLTLRRVENQHAFHRRLHDFSESIEHALTALLLMALGNVLPLVLSDLAWIHAVMAALLIVLIRPLAAWLSLFGTALEKGDRLLVSVYGVRGIGSIYYLCYAGAQIEFVNETQLWSLIGLTIMLSTMLHGFTVGWAMERLSERND